MKQQHREYLGMLIIFSSLIVLAFSGGFNGKLDVADIIFGSSFFIFAFYNFYKFIRGNQNRR